MSVEIRYPVGTVVFGKWQIQELVRTDPDTNSVSFRLVHSDNPSIQCALKVITLFQDSTHPAQLSPQQQHALKVHSENTKNCASHSLRKLQEFRNHPHLLGCQEFTFWDWQNPYGTGCDLLMRTELLQDLRSIMISGCAFPEAEIRRIGGSLCEALDLCHNNQLLYGDIRPENIFYDGNGHWKLGDFVATDLRRSFPALGIVAPQYRAPEQFQGNAYRESDIYSLGLVLYEMSNGGHLPFADTVQTLQEAVNIRLQGYALPQPQQASPALADAISRACAHNPGERYHSATEFLSDLNAAVPAVSQGNAGSAAVPVPQDPPRETRAKRHTDTAKEKEHDDSNVILIIRTAVITVLVLAVLGAAIFFALRLRDVSSPSGTEPDQLENTQSPAQPSGHSPESEATAPIVTTEATTPSLPTSHYYYSCYNPYTEFVLLYSDVQYYSPAELRELSDKELEVALAEIDARHGALPSNQLLAEYFSYLSWFTPSNATYKLSFIEEANAMLIRTLQKKRDGTLSASGNPYMPYFQANDYFMPQSGTRYLTSGDLKGLSKTELALALNEIFARHGYIFDLNELLEYFYATNWYVPTYIPEEFTYNFFSQEENENINLIVIYSDLTDYRGPREDNPYVRYMGYPEYILPNSDSVRLQASDLDGLDDIQLYLAEQEIYARHGLAFEETHLQHYFLECSWYSIEVSPSRTSRIQLSSIEQANLALIQEYRQSH